jgi:hypothetical protein
MDNPLKVGRPPKHNVSKTCKVSFRLTPEAFEIYKEYGGGEFFENLAQARMLSSRLRQLYPVDTQVPPE